MLIHRLGMVFNKISRFLTFGSNGGVKRKEQREEQTQS